MDKNKTYTILLGLYISILFIGSLPVIPLPYGQRLFVVSSGSMEPALYTGSVVIAKPQVEYRVGDIITFMNPDKNIGEKQTTTHRVERLVNKDGGIVYMTKGDANVFSDNVFIPANQVIGKVYYQFANFGFLINIIKSQLGLMFLIFIPGLLIVGKEVGRMFNCLELNKKQTSNPQKKKNNKA